MPDDMGLGKTLQVISLLLSEQESAKESGGSGTFPYRMSGIGSSATGRKRSAVCTADQTTLVTGLATERQRIVRHTKEGEVLITSTDLLKRDVECTAIWCLRFR